MFSDLFNQLQTIRYFVKTKKVVDIEKLGKLDKCVAVPETNGIKEIAPGLWLKTETTSYKPDSFVNMYDIFWSEKNNRIVPEIDSSDEPYYLTDTFDLSPKTIAAINGGFFFLADTANRQPYCLPYNLCIRKGKILGLPSNDLPTVYIKNGKICAKDTKAKGNIKIADVNISWIGAKSTTNGRKAEATLYNSKCCDVVKIRDKNNIQIGILDEVNIHTPEGEGVDDIIVGQNIKGELEVIEVKNGGGAHFFDGYFILQVPAGRHEIKIGDPVQPLDLDGVILKGITSGISTGKSVHDPFFLDPIRVDRRDARSLIAKDKKGSIHLIVFDGSKYIPNFLGVSAKEISAYFAKDTYEWVYFLDGGGSSRIVYRSGDDLVHLANRFAFKKAKGGKKIWDWEHARKMASSISLRIK